MRRMRLGTPPRTSNGKYCVIQSHKKDVAKVLGFGIAKFRELQNGTDRGSATDTGMCWHAALHVAGAAMAGSGNELEGRADILFAGSVVYQMLPTSCDKRGHSTADRFGHSRSSHSIQAARAGVEIPQPLADW